MLVFHAINHQLIQLVKNNIHKKYTVNHLLKFLHVFDLQKILFC